jgi:hypothetical protein
MGGRTSGGRTSSGRADDGGEAAVRPHGGEVTRAPSPRLAEIRDTLLRRIEKQGEVPLHRPPARWPLTREHATDLIEGLAREGAVEITRNRDGAVARLVGAGGAAAREDLGDANGTENGRRA